MTSSYASLAWVWLYSLRLSRTARSKVSPTDWWFLNATHRNPIDRCLPLTEVFFSNRQSEHPLVFMAPPRSWARSFQQMPPKAQPFQAVTVHVICCECTKAWNWDRWSIYSCLEFGWGPPSSKKCIDTCDISIIIGVKSVWSDEVKDSNSQSR